MKRNECFDTVTGRQLWDGRYSCVVGAVFYWHPEERRYYVLANKRGPGCPTNVGKWNMPCGYLDAGSGEENVAREVFEETGVSINPLQFKELYHSDLATQRNVTFRYAAEITTMIEPAAIENLIGGEPDEVSEIKWIPVDDVPKYKWAFNHEHIIPEVLEKWIRYKHC